MFKQLIMRGAIDVVQIDACRLGGVNEILAVMLMAAQYGLPVCPHAGGVFADGHIDAMGNIVCPLHHYKFSMQTGRNVTGEGYALKTYEVAVKEDGVYIGMEEKKLFGLF